MSDFLIVGGGIAGLRAAIGLADAGRALVLTKSDRSESNTGYAQGGIAAAVGTDDSPALHAADTMRAGDGLCDEAAVGVLVEDGRRGVGELIEWGARFDRDASGAIVLGREAAHSVRRVLHAGDATGREIGRVLWQRCVELPNIQSIDHARVTELLVENGRACGAAYVDADGGRHEVRARATLLATGGAGQVFSETTNPPVATGDGVALAYLAGARVADLEFVQFHPTALKHPGAPRFLISEALRGEGARLINRRGDSFMTRVHPDADLAPRDVVARGIAREEHDGRGPVCLTLAHLDAEYVHRRFPTIDAMCRSIGLDLARDPIPVGPAAHYMMGGVVTDLWGRTSLPGLFAAGEVACTGVHGANRLASNSLLEGLVFGARAAAAMQTASLGDRAEGFSALRTERHPVTHTPQPAVLSVSEIRDLMWNGVGLFRSRDGLERAVAQLSAADAADPANRHLIVVARLIARAALRREESRGGHYRSDFPQRDDARWQIHVGDELK
ncbi:MAG TPA: L-aspartate oxidase [Vicinamibacterales bacterium]